MKQEDLFQMVNALKLLETASKQAVFLTPTEIGMRPSLFESIATRCGFTLIHDESCGKNTVLLKREFIPLCSIYTREESNEFNFLAISDLHIGNDSFDEKKLHEILQKAEEREVKQVFIAGDIFEAIDNPKELDFRILNARKLAGVRDVYRSQMKKAIEIFSSHDLSYYAINGNHEYAYEQLGIISPLKELDRNLKRKGVNFNSFDTYLIDFEIAGVILRMMHLESFCEKKSSFPSMERLKEFDIMGEFEPIGNLNNELPIRFFECGHVHKCYELYNAEHNTFVIQPGAFIKADEDYESGIFVRGEVTPELNIVRF